LQGAPIDLSQWRCRVKKARLIKVTGQVSRVIGLTVEVHGINAPIGEVCEIMAPGEDEPILAEVVGFRDGISLLMPLGELRGVYQGCDVISTGKPFNVMAGDQLLGRVLNGLGEPLDANGPLEGDFTEYPVNNRPPNPLMRRRITEVMSTGVRAVDALLTCGRAMSRSILLHPAPGPSFKPASNCLFNIFSNRRPFSSSDPFISSIIGQPENFFVVRLFFNSLDRGSKYFHPASFFAAASGSLSISGSISLPAGWTSPVSPPKIISPADSALAATAIWAGGQPTFSWISGLSSKTAVISRRRGEKSPIKPLAGTL